MESETPATAPSAIVVTGGQAPFASAQALPHPALVIAADSGLHHAEALGLSVDLVVGDLDSVAPEALARARSAAVAIERHPRDKDASDLELALEAAIARQVERVIIVGGQGGRFDHLLANALLLGSPRFAGVELSWWIDGATATIVDPQRPLRLQGAVGDLLSLLPIGGDVAGITTNGLRWPLNQEVLATGSSRGISNELTAPVATVEVAAGTLLAIHQRSAQ